LDEDGIPNLDYLVRIGVVQSRSDKQAELELGDEVGGWAFGQTWTKSAMIKASIYSAETGKLVGELSADLTKEAFWMVPVLIIVPLPPVVWSPNVEATSCTEMGEALGRFFAGAGNEFIEEK
jgi:hypothetical protein